MRDDSQASTSIWMATANTPSQAPLKESIRTDVCIIGAGIAGLTTAYLLGREGRSVVILDDGVIGGGMTGRTTAHLTNAYHKTAQANDGDERFARLEQWTRERFPEMREVQFRWSGQVMEPVDGLAFIGRNPLDEENVYIATGDSGQGMTYGTIAGMLLTDLIQGRENKWEDLYSPRAYV